MECPHRYGYIQIRGARENNLKDVSLDIPKGKITVFTGVSGSGKSSLVFDTIAAESRRLLNETHAVFIQNLLPHTKQPEVDSIQCLSPGILIDQRRLGNNPRSTVGTITDTYSMLRLIFTKLGKPYVGRSNAFSFNDLQGMCPVCEGVGTICELNVDALVDRSKSLADGAILFPTFAVGSWFWNIFARSGYFDINKKLSEYTVVEWEKLMNGVDGKVHLAGEGGISSKYEGLIPKFKRLYLSKQQDEMAPHLREATADVVCRSTCPSCAGARLSEVTLACRIAGKNIAECSAMEIGDLLAFVRQIEEPMVASLIDALAGRLENLILIGLGYLSLDRGSNSLSGGESQRVKMIRHLGSSLTDIMYLFDEPASGLHAHDVQRVNQVFRRICDEGNTVLIVEHKPAVIGIADHIVDLGPGAGRSGGQVVYAGDLPGLFSSPSATGRYLRQIRKIKAVTRRANGVVLISNAVLHNLRNLTVEIPEGVLTAVTGVAGSGKSSLLRGCLPMQYPEAVVMDQSLNRGSSRSNLATYTGILDQVRKTFAKINQVSPSLFSANSIGACPVCKGLGYIYTDLAFMDPVVSQCEACDGRRFTEAVLVYRMGGKSISDVYDLSVTEALGFFEQMPFRPILLALEEVGLGYMTLGQPLSTFSGGERQRLKLAMELNCPGRIYVIDEPTAGLHMQDVDRLMNILDRLVDSGSTVVVIEHNMDVISRADWIIDMGPGAGHDGGSVVFSGTPAQMIEDGRSITAEYLRRHIQAASA